MLNAGKWVAGVSLGAIAVAAVPAIAQVDNAPASTSTVSAPSGSASAPTAAPQQDTSNQSSEMSDIVVTAQKRSESAVNVPISIAVVGGEALQTMGVRNVTELSRVVPGFRVDFSGAFSQPTIRGVGSAVLGAGISSNVATYIDGVIRPSSLSNNVPFDDIESVQVLKGPQGTLFGRNATGGAVLITTKSPSFTTGATGHFSYGRYNTIMAGASVTGGLIGDVLAGSLAVTQNRSDGFVKDIVTGKDVGGYRNYGIRSKLLFRPSETAEFLLSYEHLYANDHRIAGNSYNGWSAGAFDPNAVVGTERGKVAQDFAQFAKTTNDALTLKSTLDFGDVSLTSYTAKLWEDSYNSSDNDGSSSPILGVAWPIRERTFTQELNLTGKSGRLDWVLGGFYYNNSSAWEPLGLSVGGSPLFPFQNIRVKTKSYAVFADATWEVIDNLFLTGGARYGHDKASEVVDVLVDADPAITPSKSWNSFTPRAVLRYQIGARSNVYASYSKGFKAGVFNSPTVDPVPVDPEKITAYEIGFKTASSALQFDAAAFYYDYKNLQVASYTSTGSILKNAASSEIYGLDAKLTGRVTDGLTVTIAGAYTHARYKKFPEAAGYIWDPATGVVPVSVDASGFSVLRTPDFSGNINVDYKTDLMGGQLALSGLYSYQTRVYFDAIEYAHQKAYGTLNLRAEWTDPSDHVTFGIFGNNVTDTNYISSVLPNTAYFGQTFGDPATYGAEVKFRF
jgi:iron complex outermembrane receptor protein